MTVAGVVDVVTARLDGGGQARRLEFSFRAFGRLRPLTLLKGCNVAHALDFGVISGGVCADAFNVFALVVYVRPAAHFVRCGGLRG